MEVLPTDKEGLRGYLTERIKDNECVNVMHGQVLFSLEYLYLSQKCVCLFEAVPPLDY